MSDFDINELVVKINKNVVYLSGITPSQSLKWSDSLHGFLIGVLPSAFKPSHRRIFLTQSGRIDITPEGNIVLMSENSRLVQQIKLNGIRCTIDNGIQLNMLNGWRGFGHPYQHPCVTKLGTTIYLSGVMTGGLSNQSFSQLPRNARPSRKISFFVGDACIDILPTGECLVLGSHQTRLELSDWYSLDGIYFENDTYLPLVQSGGGHKMSNVSNGFVDNIQNVQFLDLNAKIPYDGIITEWQAEILQPGDTIFQIYRHLSNDNHHYQLVDEINHTFERIGHNLVKLTRPLKVKKGDYLGWRYPQTGTMKYEKTNGNGNVKWLFGHPSPNGHMAFMIGEPRTYVYKVKIVMDKGSD